MGSVSGRVEGRFKAAFALSPKHHLLVLSVVRPSVEAGHVAHHFEGEHAVVDVRGHGPVSETGLLWFSVVALCLEVDADVGKCCLVLRRGVVVGRAPPISQYSINATCCSGN